MCCFGAAESRATDFFWNDASGGFFNVPANWNPVGTPGSGDDAIFNLDAPYTVDFNTSQATDGLDVLDGDVTFSPNNLVTYTTSETMLINNGALLRLTGNGANTFLLDSTHPNSGLRVGDSLGGGLTIQDGAAAQFAGRVAVATGEASTGVLLVGGENASLNVPTSSLTIGESGNGTLNVTNGGRVDSRSAGLGAVVGSTGVANILGADSTWTISSGLVVGVNGDGRLTIDGGGSVISEGSTFLGGDSGGDGTVTVRGADSMWTNTQELFIGSSGSGTLTIEEGGSVSSLESSLGGSISGSGEATVRGPDSTWVSASVTVGVNGDGDLTIEKTAAA